EFENAAIREAIGRPRAGAPRIAETLRRLKANRVARAAVEALKLPAKIVGYLADELVAHYEVLKGYFNRIGKLTQPAIEWLFGCHSKCHRTTSEVTGTLDAFKNDEIERLAKEGAGEAVTQAEMRVKETKNTLRAAADKVIDAWKEVEQAKGGKKGDLK